MEPVQPYQQQEQYFNPNEKAAIMSNGHYHQQPIVNGQGYGYASPPTTAMPLVASPPPPASVAPGGGPKGIVIKRSVALGAIAIIFLLFGAVIGLAAGLGMTQESLRQARNDVEIFQAILGGGSAANGTTADITTSAGAPAGTTTTPTATSTSAEPSATAAQPLVQCPSENGTFYTSTTDDGVSKQFQRLCGIDYGQGEAEDIGSEKVASLDECIDACAAKKGCTGAGWGVIEGDKPGQHACWMKTDLVKSHPADEDWGFAVLITDEEEK